MRLNIFIKYVTLLGLVIFLVSCTTKAPFESGPLLHQSATFWKGLWHGFTFFFSLLGKIFTSDIGIHETMHTGFRYWVGYFVGFVLFVKLIFFIAPNMRNTKNLY